MKTTTERRKEIERLSLLCALDRAQMRLDVRQTRRRTGLTGLPSVVGDALGLAKFLPGRWGRWARRLSCAASILRSFG